MTLPAATFLRNADYAPSFIKDAIGRISRTGSILWISMRPQPRKDPAHTIAATPAAHGAGSM
jgi:hypothetical protein